MTKNLLKIPVFVLVLLLCSFCVFAQNGSSTAGAENPSFSVQSTAGQNQPQGGFNFNVTPSSADERAPSTFGLFVKMVFSLAVVLGLVYLVVYLLKKSTKTVDSGDPFLRKVAQISLGAGKSVQIVTLLDHAYLVGVTDNSINPIAKIDDKELVDSLNLYADKNANVSKPRSFADVLELFMPHGPRDGNVFNDDAKSVSEMLKRQRERFNNGEQ